MMMLIGAGASLSAMDVEYPTIQTEGDFVDLLQANDVFPISVKAPPLVFHPYYGISQEPLDYAVLAYTGWFKAFLETERLRAISCQELTRDALCSLNQGDLGSYKQAKAIESEWVQEVKKSLKPLTRAQRSSLHSIYLYIREYEIASCNAETCSEISEYELKWHKKKLENTQNTIVALSRREALN